MIIHVAGCAQPVWADTTGACFFVFCHLSYSKMNVDKRVESPIPLLPLSTPDADTEKLIKMKDEEVSGEKEIRVCNKFWIRQVFTLPRLWREMTQAVSYPSEVSFALSLSLYLSWRGCSRCFRRCSSRCMNRTCDAWNTKLPIWKTDSSRHKWMSIFKRQCISPDFNRTGHRETCDIPCRVTQSVRDALWPKRNILSL